jgi:hypothetical protein
MAVLASWLNYTPFSNISTSFCVYTLVHRCLDTLVSRLNFYLRLLFQSGVSDVVEIETSASALHFLSKAIYAAPESIPVGRRVIGRVLPSASARACGCTSVRLRNQQTSRVNPWPTLRQLGICNSAHP